MFCYHPVVQEVVQSDDLDLLTARHLQAWCLWSINDLNSDCQRDYYQIGVLSFLGQGLKVTVIQRVATKRHAVTRASDLGLNKYSK